MQSTIVQLAKAGVVVSLLAGLPIANANELDIVVKSAPIVPHGLIAGQPLDVTLSFADLNPAVPGLTLKKGATAKIYLPTQVENMGYPVSKPGEAEGCEPPVLKKCSSGGFLNGWPQSPLLPLNTISYDESDHALTLTAIADSPPYSKENPGAKLIHLFTFGFMNPGKVGDYPLKVVIQPDPSQIDVHTGTAILNISEEKQPTVAIDSTQAPHVKGPMYRNTMYQNMKPGDTSYSMSANLWDADHQAIVGATVSMISETEGNLLAADGTKIGSVEIEVPKDAKGFVLMSAPSFAAKTGLAGYPTGRLVMALRTASKVKGDYNVVLALDGGNSIEHRLTAE